MTETIGVSVPDRIQGRKSCPHCADEFGFHDFWPFIFINRGATIQCMVCAKESYLRPRRNGFFWLMVLLAIAAGAAAFLVINGGLALATLSPDGSFYISWIALALGAVLGVWTARAVMKAYNYNTGTFATTREESAFDFMQ